jgi:hypothetical protein
MNTAYVRDACSHSLEPATVLGAARLKDGTTLVYVRRASTGQFAGYLFDMYARDSSGAWSQYHKAPGLIDFMCNRPVGTAGRASNRSLEVVNFIAEVPNRCIDVPSPPSGFGWQNANLSEQEQRTLARSLGPMAR